MADIAVRKNGNKPAGLANLEQRLEPFRIIRDLMGFDPFREMTPFVPQVGAGFVPSFEVKESKDAYIFKADLPGVKESDIEVTVTGSRLTISGRREAEKQEQTDAYYTYERSYGDFTRSFALPEGVDMNSVNAELKDGVLSLTVKKTPEAQPKKIAVQSQSSVKKS